MRSMRRIRRKDRLTWAGSGLGVGEADLGGWAGGGG